MNKKTILNFELFRSFLEVFFITVRNLTYETSRKGTFNNFVTLWAGILTPFPITLIQDLLTLAYHVSSSPSPTTVT